MAKKDQGKATIFATHLNTVFKPNPRKISAEDEEFIHDFLNNTHEPIILLLLLMN